MSTDHASRAEAFLFSEGGTLSLRKLEQLLGIKRPELLQALRELSERLANHGLSLIQTETEASLAVSAATSGAVRAAYEKELKREIGDAGLEVLAIVLYRGASTRTQIDYIRGVNTASTIRTLLARGLLERMGNPADAREYLYRPTTELLAYLGVRSADELPDKHLISGELAAFEKAQATSDEDHESAA